MKCALPLAVYRLPCDFLDYLPLKQFVFIYWSHSSVKTVTNILHLGYFSQKFRLLTSLEKSKGLAFLGPPFQACAFPQETNSRPQVAALFGVVMFTMSLLLHSFYVSFLSPVTFEFITCILHICTTSIQYFYSY